MKCDKDKRLSWRCRFSEHNTLGLKEIYVSAPTLGDVIIKLHDDLKPSFIASHLLEVSFYSVYYE